MADRPAHRPSGWRAQELLDCTGEPVERVAAACGLIPLMLRRHFARRYGATPQACRRTFSQTR